MDTIIPTNYLPPGREPLHNGFGFVTNKNAYAWLEENSIAKQRRDDLLKQVDKQMKSYDREQRTLVKDQSKVVDYYNEIISNRINHDFSQDTFRDEYVHQSILKYKI